MTDEHLQRTAILETRMEAMHNTLEEIKPMVSETHQRITQWGGVVTGIVLAVSTFWFGLLGLWAVIKHKVSG